jgi:Family of unknown function (DUF6790)
MLYLYAFLIVAALAASLHIILSRKPLSPGKVPAICLIHLLFWAAGLPLLLAFAGHCYPPQAAVLADQIGWPPGNPFQFEVGIANLTIGLLAILSLWIRGTFYLAAVVAVSIYLLGCAWGHIIQMVVHGNFHPGNAGAPFVFDLLIPALLILFTILYRVRAGKDQFRRGLFAGSA